MQKPDLLQQIRSHWPQPTRPLTIAVAMPQHGRTEVERSQAIALFSDALTGRSDGEPSFVHQMLVAKAKKLRRKREALFG